MDKLVRTIMLLVIVGVLVGGVLWYINTRNSEPGPLDTTIQSPPGKQVHEKPRVEEKHGFTSQGVGN